MAAYKEGHLAMVDDEDDLDDPDDDDEDDDDEEEQDDDDVDDDDDEDDEDEDDSDGSGDGNGSELGEEEDEEADEGVDGASVTESGVSLQKRGSSSLASKREREWESRYFIQKSRSRSGSVVYKTLLVPERSFFSKEQFEEFAKGRKFKKLLLERRKGMRTYNEAKVLKAKADARRARSRSAREEKRKAKRKQKATALSSEEIELRKAAFQAKKARRKAKKGHSALE
uniref:Uncharacterized protein n=1 Tax=Coccolithus braarudii TaxID=221442 RepID=A0A7S0L2F3_9EUKA